MESTVDANIKTEMGGGREMEFGKERKNKENKGKEQKSHRKQLRDKLVLGLLNHIRGSGMPDKISGFLLKSLHFHIPWYFLLLFLLLPFDLACYSLVPLLISLSLFLYLRGCFLTIVEFKLGQEDTNIIDPYIVFCKDEINEETRYKYTLGVAAMYFSLVALILITRYKNI